MKTILTLSTLIILLSSCSKRVNDKESYSNQNINQDIEQMRNTLLGEWFFPDYKQNVNECDTCTKFIFNKNDTILLITPDHYLEYFYEVSAKDSISVMRHWEDTNSSFRNTTHKVNFIGNDTVHIQGFVRSPLGVRDVELVRNYKNKTKN